MLSIPEYLNSKNVEYKREGGELIIICPHCGKQKLSINIQTKLFQCWNCKALHPESPYAKGHFSRLQKLWGDIADISDINLTLPVTKKIKPDTNFSELTSRYHASIWDNKTALKYWMKRGFNTKDIAKYKLGYLQMKGEEWVSIPSFINKIPKLLKYRKITNNHPEIKKYKREFGSESILFNQDAIDKFEEIFIVEGEIDAITLIKHGYENTVGMTVGASTLKTEWFEKLYLKNKVYLVLDNDPAGQTSARDVWATRLGITKCWNILLPEKVDINQFFLKSNKEEFDKYVKAAKLFKINGISSLQEVIKDMYEKGQNPENEITYKLPWENVNKLIGGGLKKKRLTIVAGVPGVGKTTWTLGLCYHIAKTYQLPTLYWCMEMPEIDLLTKIIQLSRDITYEEVNYKNAYVYAVDLMDVPLYFGYSSKITPDIFSNTMTEVRNRFGVGLGVFDNLQRLVRSGEESDMARASGMFKDITMDLNIPFILVSQPKRLPPGALPENSSLKGSGSIEADTDTVIWVHRKPVKSDSITVLDSTTDIVVSKSRYAKGGVAKLDFIGEKSKFIELPY